MTIWTHLAFWPPKQPLFGVPNELTSKCCCPGRSDRLRLAGIDGAQIGGGGTEQHAHSSAEGQGMTMFSALFLSLFWLMLNDGIMKNLLVELDVFSKNGLAMSGLDPCGVGECWFKRDRICRKLPKSTTIVSVPMSWSMLLADLEPSSQNVCIQKIPDTIETTCLFLAQVLVVSQGVPESNKM